MVTSTAIFLLLSRALFLLGDLLVGLRVEDLLLNSVGKSDVLKKIFTHKLLFLPVEKVPPRQNLDLSIPDHEHLQLVDLCLHTVQPLTGISVLPLFKL